MKHIAIFVSGEGTNAERIIDYFNNGDIARVVLVISNNSKSGALDRAIRKKVPIMILDRKDFFSDESIIKFLISEKIDLIVLAGFLWKIPEKLIQAFSNKIINIHPALLPKYGGKGMFGAKVHQAVINAKEQESGISIHYVNENFDEGKIIFQATCKVDDNESVESMAKKIHELEYLHYPEVIKKVLSK